MVCAAGMYLAPTPRERERWHALWLLCRGLTASATAQALGRDAHTIGIWAAAFGEGGPTALIFEQSGGSPPPSAEAQQADLKAAVQELPTKSGIELANWNWKVVRQLLSERFSIGLSRSTCLNYLHRLGFAFKRPKKRLLKADTEKRESFVAELRRHVGGGPAVRGQDILRRRGPTSVRTPSAGQVGVAGRASLGGLEQPALRRKGSYYSAVCLETGEVDWMELEGNSNSGTSAAFLDRLRQRHAGRST